MNVVAEYWPLALAFVLVFIVGVIAGAEWVRSETAEEINNAYIRGRYEQIAWFGRHAAAVLRGDRKG